MASKNAADYVRIVFWSVAILGWVVVIASIAALAIRGLLC
jgi:hypothetical protein